MSKFCPLLSHQYGRSGDKKCIKECCEWWNELEKKCSIVVIAEGLEEENPQIVHDTILNPELARKLRDRIQTEEFE